MPKGPPLPVQRDDAARLPARLASELEAAGGLWWASDYYTRPEEVIAHVQETGAKALRLDFRDLSLLDSMPDLQYLFLRSDGIPEVTPIGGLRHLRALLVATRGMRGTLDPLAFPELRWLQIGLGGKLGPTTATAIERGHAGLEWLALTETRVRTVTDLCGRFPSLRVLRIGFADYLRHLGRLVAASPRLEKLSLHLAPIESLDGLAGAHALTTLDLQGGRVTDLAPLREIPTLRYAKILQPRLESIEPLRGHPGIRMLSLVMAREPDPGVLASLPNLVGVVHGKGFEQEVPWPDLIRLGPGDPLRREWFAAMDA